MKTRIFVGLLMTLCMLVLNTTTLFAGAWTMKKGASYHRVAANYYFADEEFDRNGDTHGMAWNGEFLDFNMSYYGEYGVTDDLTILTSLYYKDIQQKDDYSKNDNNDMGDVDLAARYCLHNSNAGVFSIQGLVKIPELYDEEDALPLGNGQYDYELRLLYGRSLWPIIPGYMNLEAGYRWRTKKPSDEFRYLVEVGSDLGKNFYARAKLDAIIGIGNGDADMDAFGNPSSTLEYDLAKLDLTIGYKLTRTLGLELGFTPALWGETTAKGETWTFAITFQPKR